MHLCLVLVGFLENTGVEALVLLSVKSCCRVVLHPL
jgi:hypothetical protein